jgi:glycosyltransferase involved in cell wall biosynthesis
MLASNEVVGTSKGKPRSARQRPRLAIIVSHPIQYLAPLYQRLAARDDIEIKVFFTCHAGEVPVKDLGFNRSFAWDIPLTDGYEHEQVPNTAWDPGTHHFFGLVNPSLVRQVRQWKPDAVQLTGWAWYSHMSALRKFHRLGIPVLFRGDSHLLDGIGGPRWWLKRAVLSRVYSKVARFLVVGQANRKYFEAFGVKANRLCDCPHSIDVARFMGTGKLHEEQAAEWRRQLGLGGHQRTVLFAGKFEPKKRPLELMRAVQMRRNDDLVLILAGGGELEPEIRAMAAESPQRFVVLPFQNQTRMPVVYRLGDFFILPSAYGESWGLAVNEALACGRPVLVSDRVGCAADLIDDSCGRVFSWADSGALERMLDEMSQLDLAAMGAEASKRASSFDIGITEAALVRCLLQVCDR